MATEHGGTDPGQHSHGGSAGLGWELLDTIVTAAVVTFVCLLVDLLWRARQAKLDGVRYDLTPEGLAVAEPAPVPATDTDEA